MKTLKEFINEEKDYSSEEEMYKKFEQLNKDLKSKTKFKVAQYLGDDDYELEFGLNSFSYKTLPSIKASFKRRTGDMEGISFSSGKVDIKDIPDLIKVLEDIKNNAKTLETYKKTSIEYIKRK